VLDRTCDSGDRAPHAAAKPDPVADRILIAEISACQDVVYNDDRSRRSRIVFVKSRPRFKEIPIVWK
jgi:hypothetical protein